MKLTLYYSGYRWLWKIWKTRTREDPPQCNYCFNSSVYCSVSCVLLCIISRYSTSIPILSIVIVEEICFLYATYSNTITYTQTHTHRYSSLVFAPTMTPTMSLCIYGVTLYMITRRKYKYSHPWPNTRYIKPSVIWEKSNRWNCLSFYV
jgi:hypothetical protein